MRLSPTLLLILVACGGDKEPNYGQGQDDTADPTGTDDGTGTDGTGTDGTGTDGTGTDGTGTGTGTGDDGGTTTGSCEEYDPGTLTGPGVDAACIQSASTPVFDPETTWQWSSNSLESGYVNVLSTPVVADLDGDGIPEILVLASDDMGSSAEAALVALEGDGSGERWSALAPGGQGLWSQGSPAVADLDGDGLPEICTPGSSASVVCLSSDGSLAWASGTDSFPRGAPALADLDGDGTGEVILGGSVYAHDGSLLATCADCTVASDSRPAVADLDGDGLPEIVDAGCAWEADGTLLWAWSEATLTAPAIGDLDLDGEPEIVFAADDTGLYAFEANGTLIWTAAASSASGGPPTIADFDGDGLPDVGSAGLSGYSSLAGATGASTWSATTTENRSPAGTAAVAFDFEGDGASELIYADENTVWFLNGATGAAEAEITGHNSGTAHEYPVVADLDGDGSAEIIVPSNHYLSEDGWQGITVISSATAAWKAARPIWNQYAYSNSNIDDDGSLPFPVIDAWTRWNGFRAADSASGKSNGLADLAPGDPVVCEDTCGRDEVTLWLPVSNYGTLDAEEVVVDLIRGAETVAATATVALIPAGGAEFAGPFVIQESEWGGGLAARVNSEGLVAECDTGDNDWPLGGWPCK